MSVSFGVHTGQQDMAMDDFRALWREMEEDGLDWISLWDHFYEAPPRDDMGPHFETVACLATLAAETERVRIGCLVFCALYRNPALLAKAVATIDHISHGRLEIGLGAGWHEPEFKGYGYGFPPLGQRLDALEEAVQIVRSMLTQERTTFKGTHFTVLGATCQPPPVQERLPIWIGGGGERRTLRMAARYADGWNVPYIGPERFRHLNGVLDDWCAKEGRDPSTIGRTVNLRFNLVAGRGRVEAMEASVREQWGAEADEIIAGSLLGTPDDAADRIAEYIDAGAQAVNIALRAPWDKEALRVYAREVVPAMRRRFA